jgi:ribosomal protein S18 acetylase RimI-like enzyme
MKITITTPRLSDAPTMFKWGKESSALKDEKNDTWYSLAVLRKWIKNPKDDIIFVARDGKTLIGMCLVHGMREWAYFSSLYVAKGYRGKGVGTALMTKMTEILKKQKYRECALLVKETNTEAQEFHRKLGFKKGYLFRWMGKKL